MTATTEHTFDPPEGATGGDGQTGPLVRLPADAAHATIDILLQLHEFFRHHASDAVHAELRAFCRGLGRHPVCGADALLDQLWLHVLPLRWALDAEAAAPADQAATITTIDINHNKETT
jgi:hypothetical protein